jgi:hypothetical protein
MQNMSVKSAEFSTNYVERFKYGTISRWRLIDKRTRKPVDYWYSRNGLDVPSEEASMVEHFTKNSLGNEFTVQRPMFARRKAHFETSIPEQITGADVTNDVKRFSDAEIKAIQRGFRTKRELGLSSENLILEGYVDKPNCPVCSLNLEHFEGIGHGKVASEIKIFHYSQDVHDTSFRNQRKNVVAEITGCY